MATFIREQFTFYRSFYDALCCLSDKERLVAYDILMAYALYGEKPDERKVSSTVMMFYSLVRPHVENGRKKAMARLGLEQTPVEEEEHGPDEPPAEEENSSVVPLAEQNENKKKNKSKDKSKDKSKIKYKKESFPPISPPPQAEGCGVWPA